MNIFFQSPIKIFKYKNFRYVWLSEGLSLFGSEMEMIVLAIYVFQTTGSPFHVAAISALKFGGNFLAPLFGVFVDKFDRKTLQLIVRYFGFSVSLMFLMIMIIYKLEIWHIYILVSLGSILRTLDLLVIQSLTADSVPSDNLHGALGISRSTLDASRVISFAMGGLILELFGIIWVYVTIAVVNILAIWAAIKINKPTQITTSFNNIFKNLKMGFHEVKINKKIQVLIFFSFMVEMTVFPLVNGMIAVFAKEFFYLGATGTGLLASVISLGTLTGALIVASNRQFHKPGYTIIIGSIIWHLLGLTMIFSNSLVLTMILLLGWGVAGGVTFVAMISSLIRLSPDVTRGRIMGLRALAIYGLPIGLVFSGWLAESFGVKQMIIIPSIMGIFGTLLSIIVWPSVLKITFEKLPNKN